MTDDITNNTSDDWPGGTFHELNLVRIGDVKNYYGGVFVVKEGGKYFWILEEHHGEWLRQAAEEIPQYLYEALRQFERERLLILESKRSSPQTPTVFSRFPEDAQTLIRETVGRLNHEKKMMAQLRHDPGKIVASRAFHETAIIPKPPASVFWNSTLCCGCEETYAWWVAARKKLQPGRTIRQQCAACHQAYEYTATRFTFFPEEGI